MSSFDHHDAEQMLDPCPRYDELRRLPSLAHSDRHGGYWVVSRYHDVVAAATDHAHLCSGQGIAVPSLFDVRVEPQEADPPRHTLVRTMMTPWFSTGAVAAMEPLVRSASAELLDAVAGREEFDLAVEYAAPLASRVMLRLLGFPESLEDRLHVAIDGMLHLGGDPVGQAAAAADLTACVTEVIARRRVEPAGTSTSRLDDLLAVMLAAELDGEQISDGEAISFVLSLIFAGFETSANTIATAAFHLARYPDLWVRLRGEPELLLSATEELLRYVSPVPAIGRKATAEVVLGGTTVAAGETVLLLYGSANHDGEVFPEPEQLDLQRAPNRHLAFGSGIHRCLGRHLARLEIRVALSDLAARFSAYELADPDRVAWGFGENRGVQSLPVRVTEVRP